MKITTAILSVSNKEGIVEFARSLDEMGVQILSTGGTGRALAEAGIPFTKVSDHTGFPEILDGRVKTLHPKIHGGILARHDDAEHQATMEEHQIAPIGLVAVNLYPFTETIQKEGVTEKEAIENIDIGGPTMLRAAAKNFAHTTVVVEPADYARVIAEIKAGNGEVDRETRRALASKAFHHTAAYDSAISGYFQTLASPDEGLPVIMNLSLGKEADLRYGENPHQRAALYRPRFHPPTGIVSAVQHHGKKLSFNNYLDLHSAWELVREFDETSCAIIKHTNPCGAAQAGTLVEAYKNALECDPVSAFGSIVACNRQVDEATANEISKLFVEAVVSPGYDEKALTVLTQKKNIRIMEMPERKGCSKPHSGFDLKRISGGVLVQDRDTYFVTEDDLKVVTRRKPSEDELKDLLFGWVICKHVKSNAIVYVKDQRTVGVGAGQMSRVDSAKIAAEKARSSLGGAVMASDAFFPFRDGLDEAAERGIRAVIQPGGSVRDQEVIDAADEHDIAMVFTEIRHFRH